MSSSGNVCVLAYLCMRRTVAGASSSGCQSKSVPAVASTVSNTNNEPEELKWARTYMLIESRNICLHSPEEMAGGEEMEDEHEMHPILMLYKPTRAF